MGKEKLLLQKNLRFFKVAYKHSLKEMLRSQVQHLTHEHRTSEPLRLSPKDHKIQPCSPIEGLQSEKSFIFLEI